jgi:hypothetical protein
LNPKELSHIAAALVGFALACAATFVVARRPTREHPIWTILLIVTVLLTPLLILPTHRVIRLLSTVFAVMLGAKAYDLAGDESASDLSPIGFAIYLFNPFSIVRRSIIAERKHPPSSDWLSVAINGLLGAVALFLAIQTFSINWLDHAAIAERSAKTFAVFFVIQFLPNALAALSRRFGIDSTDFSGLFIFARTPAEFWRIYNRPAEQFFRVHAFNPAGGRRHFVRATLATFFVSGLIHEYVFDVAAGRLLGTQMLFFMIQAIAVIATAKLRPNARISMITVPATLAFNVLSGTIFMSSMNAVIRIWHPR